ncbi:MAG: hypothetical protein Roseis2KO_06920 [Roseivirga sp.]
MDNYYENRLDGLIRQIEKLSMELLKAPEKHQGHLIDAYLKKIDNLKQKILALKIEHFLKGGLYQ